MKRIHLVAPLGVVLASASAFVHCVDSYDDTSMPGYGGTYVDASAFDGGSTTQKDGGGGACVSIDYSQARSCDARLRDAGPDARPADAGDAGDGGGRSNTLACRTSFDCAGVCCSCPPRDAGADAAPAADAGDSGAFTAYACACGVCQVDPGMCSRMLAGDPTLCR
jgi:hypothetical protein